MGPIWPSYFKDCSSVIVCYHIMRLYHLTRTVWFLYDCFCLCVFTVCGGLGQHCSDSFVLYPAADGPLSRGAAQRFRPYSLQQEVTQTHSGNNSHQTRIESNTQARSKKNISVRLPPSLRDMPCTMSLTEIKSLFRMDDIIASATQPTTILEVSALSGQGLREVLSWLESIAAKWTAPPLCL